MADMYQLTPPSPGLTYLKRDADGVPTETIISSIADLDAALEDLEYDADDLARLTVNDKVYAVRLLTDPTGV